MNNRQVSWKRYYFSFFWHGYEDYMAFIINELKRWSLKWQIKLDNTSECQLRALGHLKTFRSQIWFWESVCFFFLLFILAWTHCDIILKIIIVIFNWFQHLWNQIHISYIIQVCAAALRSVKKKWPHLIIQYLYLFKKFYFSLQV